MPTPEQVEKCSRMLFKLAIKHGVAPKIISGRLLNSEDKQDMLDGLISLETLHCFVKAWKEGGMYDYSNGLGALYSDFKLYRYEGGG